MGVGGWGWGGGGGGGGGGGVGGGGGGAGFTLSVCLSIHPSVKRIVSAESALYHPQSKYISYLHIVSTKFIKVCDMFIFVFNSKI